MKNKKEKESKLNKFLMWLYYNHPKMQVDDAIYEISSEFTKATSTKNKYCTCKNKGKAVNGIWVDWHCTYCLKPKALKKHNGN